MGYRGESLGKKFARAMLVDSIRALPDHLQHEQSRVVFLASAVGGDVAMLEAAGFYRHRMLAVDKDPAAERVFREKFPDVPFARGDVADICEREGKFEVIYLDLCGTLHPKQLETARRCLVASSRDGSSFAITLFRGRERQRATGWIKRRRLENRFRSEATKRRLRNGQFSIEDARIAPAEAAPDLVYDGTDERTEIMTEKLQQALLHDRIALEPEATFTYQSRGGDSNGSPMMLVAYRVRRYPKWYSFGSFVKKAKRINEGYKHVSIDFSDVRTCDLAKHLATSKDLERVADQFNVTLDSAKALKAHYTRGTYDHELKSQPRRTIKEKREQLEALMAMPNPTKADLQELDVWQAADEMARRAFETFPRLKEKQQYVIEVFRYCLLINMQRHCDIKLEKADTNKYLDPLLKLWTGITLEHTEPVALARPVFDRRPVSSGYRQGPSVHRQVGHLVV